MVEEINGKTFYTIQEFAQIISVAESTVYHWIDEGKLNFWQVAPKTAIRIPSTEIHRYLQPKK